LGIQRRPYVDPKAFAPERSGTQLKTGYSVISLSPECLFQSFDWHFGHAFGDWVVAHVCLH
jgi:hypothetical protein